MRPTIRWRVVRFKRLIGCYGCGMLMHELLKLSGFRIYLCEACRKALEG